MQQKAWPVVVEADTQIKLLSRTVRRTIDACSINERRLDWLLAVHKFEVNFFLLLFYVINGINIKYITYIIKNINIGV